MHQQTLSLNPHNPTSNYGLRFSPPLFIQNPRLRTSNIKTNHFNHHQCAVRGNRISVNCINNGVEVSVANNRRHFPFNLPGVKEFDVATLGNLCVDVVLKVPKLPPSSFDERKNYMEQLYKSPPDKMVFPLFGYDDCPVGVRSSKDLEFRILARKKFCSHSKCLFGEEIEARKRNDRRRKVERMKDSSTCASVLWF